MVSFACGFDIALSSCFACASIQRQGNARFRDLVLSRLDEYSAATSKLEKSAIVTSILYSVRTRSPKGGFIKKDPLTGEWYEVCMPRFVFEEST